MRNGFTQSMAWLHTWGGLAFGWLLFAIFLTGTLSVFEHEISHWMRPELHRVGAVSQAEAIARAERLLRHEAPHAAHWQIVLPDEGEAAAELRWQQDGAWATRYMDAATGDPIAVRETLGGHFFVDFHYSLMAGRTGIWVVAAATVAMLATLLSGIIIHKRIFRDFFTFRPRATGQRAWLDAHNACGVLALPFHLMITYTGLVISFGIYMPVGLQLFFENSAGALRSQVVTSFERSVAGQPAELLPIAPFLEKAEAVLGQGAAQMVVVHDPGDASAVIEFFRRFDDRIAAVADHVAFDGVTGAWLGSQTEWNRAALAWRTMVGLHLAQFGGDAMRWLYFLCGLAGTAMIGSGLVLFTAKRRTRHAAEASRFDRSVARLNVSAIAGVIIACVAYLWFNRLLPAGLPGRESWEVGLLLPVWLVSLTHALVRRSDLVWPEQLGLAAFLCLALPVLDAATGGAPLSAATPGLGSAAVLDLTALGCGLALALVARRLARPDARAVRKGAADARGLARQNR